MSVSVIIPAYNRAALLPQTLDAVLAQTVPASEIIVVDDGSTDHTAAVAQSYAATANGTKFNCIITANGGEHAARNIGLRAASGRLVAFCDSDDLWRPDFLARMLALWQAAPGIRAAYADFVLVRDGVWDSTSKFASVPPGYWDRLRIVGAEMGVFDAPIIDQVIRFQPFFPSCLVTDRQAFLEVGGWDEGAGRLVGSDLATTLRVAENLPVGVLRRPLVGIRKHAGNYSADVLAMNLGDARVLEYVLATRPGLRPFEPAIRASIARRRRDALDSAFARRDFATVRRIAALQPPGGVVARVKRGVAALPEPGCSLLAEALLALGTARSSLAAGRRRGHRPGGA